MSLTLSHAARVGVALMFLGGFASAQRSYGPITVDTKYGQLVLSDVTLWRRSSITQTFLPWFSANIQNLTRTKWHSVELDVGFRCPGSEQDTHYKVDVPTIGLSDSLLRFSETTPEVIKVTPCDPDTVTISMQEGWSDRGKDERDQLNRAQVEAAMEGERQAREQAAREEDAAERRRLAAERAAERKKQAKREAEEKALREYLAKYPVLNSGAPATFVGADRKCSEQFVQALSMEGLEKRKRLADLVSYGCGFIEDADVHAMRLQTLGAYCQVRLINGKHPNESGWVPCSWIR